MQFFATVTGTVAVVAAGFLCLARPDPPDPTPRAVERALTEECRRGRAYNWELRVKLAERDAEVDRLRRLVERDRVRRAGGEPEGSAEVRPADRIPPTGLPTRPAGEE